MTRNEKTNEVNARIRALTKELANACAEVDRHNHTYKMKYEVSDVENAMLVALYVAGAMGIANGTLTVGNMLYKYQNLKNAVQSLAGIEEMTGIV